MWVNSSKRFIACMIVCFPPPCIPTCSQTLRVQTVYFFLAAKLFVGLVHKLKSDIRLCKILTRSESYWIWLIWKYGCLLWELGCAIWWVFQFPFWFQDSLLLRSLWIFKLSECHWKSLSRYCPNHCCTYRFFLFCESCLWVRSFLGLHFQLNSYYEQLL